MFVHLKFYIYEFQKHHHQTLYEWLLEIAKKNGMEGGSVFRAIAGFGHHGVQHEQKFFELGANTPLEVGFNTTEEKAKWLLEEVKKNDLDLFYTLSQVHCGHTLTAKK